MKVSTHVISTSIICLILIVLTDWYNAVLFFIGGVLVDFDHYLNYAKVKKDLSLARAYKWHLKILSKIRAKPEKFLVFHVFHSVEFILLLLLVSYFFNNYFLLLGVGFHSLLDLVKAFRCRTASVRKLSFIQYLLVKSKSKKDKIIL